MLKPLEDVAPCVVAFEAEGTVTADDYENSLIPAVEDVLDSLPRARLLYVLGSNFEKFSMGAAFADSKVGFNHLHDFDRIAVVTDHDWFSGAVRGFGVMLPCPVRVFSLDELEAAKHWISDTPSDGFTLDIESNGDTAFLQARLHGAFDREAEDKLLQAAEEGIGDAKHVNVCIEASDFNGWREFRALWHHIRFIIGKRGRLGRLAVVGDATWQRRILSTARHVLRVDARFFEPGQLDEARTWARA